MLHVVDMAGVHLLRSHRSIANANANANTNASHPSPPSRSIHPVPILASCPASDHLLWLPKRRDAEEPEPRASRRMEGNPSQPKLPSQFDHANGFVVGIPQVPSGVADRVMRMHVAGLRPTPGWACPPQKGTSADMPPSAHWHLIPGTHVIRIRTSLHRTTTRTWTKPSPPGSTRSRVVTVTVTITDIGSYFERLSEPIVHLGEDKRNRLLSSSDQVDVTETQLRPPPQVWAEATETTGNGGEGPISAGRGSGAVSDTAVPWKTVFWHGGWGFPWPSTPF